MLKLGSSTILEDTPDDKVFDLTDIISGPLTVNQSTWRIFEIWFAKIWPSQMCIFNGKNKDKKKSDLTLF